MDDLESFIWVLSWALVHILKKYGSKDPGILQMEALSSKDLGKIVVKETVVDRFWPDVAFGNLMRDWLRILMLARDDVEQLRSAFSKTLAGSPNRVIARKDLALFCDGV